MKTYTQTTYHLIFTTKNRLPTLISDSRNKLYAYIWGITKEKQCRLIRIGGYHEHIHMLFQLHPSISLSDFVCEIKTSSTRWIKREHIFPEFESWQKGYSAFSVSHSHSETIKNYIMNQEDHHKHVSFLDEYKGFLEEAGLKIDENYLP